MKNTLRNTVDEEKTRMENVENPMWNNVNMSKEVHSMTLNTPIMAHKSWKSIERLVITAVCMILADFLNLARQALIIKGSNLIVYRHWLLQSHKHPKAPPPITIATYT